MYQLSGQGTYPPPPSPKLQAKLLKADALRVELRRYTSLPCINVYCCVCGVTIDMDTLSAGGSACVTVPLLEINKVGGAKVTTIIEVTTLEKMSSGIYAKF